MPDITTLHQMIKTTAKLPLVDNYNRKSVKLTEPQQPSSSVTINGIPENAIVIKADAFQSPDAVFNGSRGECKRADYVIIANAGSKKIILCIEMKTTKGSRLKIVQQLMGAKCFVTYCQEIGKTFWNQINFLNDYNYRFISIGHTSIAKRKTRIDRKSGVHDEPEKMLKIDWPHHLEFNRLAGGN